MPKMFIRRVSWSSNYTSEQIFRNFIAAVAYELQHLGKALQLILFECANRIPVAFLDHHVNYPTAEAGSFLVRRPALLARVSPGVLL